MFFWFLKINNAIHVAQKQLLQTKKEKKGAYGRDWKNSKYPSNLTSLLRGSNKVI